MLNESLLAHENDSAPRMPNGSNPEGMDPDPPLNWIDISSLDGIVLANSGGSPPCAKIRTHLAYKKVSYQVQPGKEYHRGKTKGVDYTKVPSVRVGDREVNDSFIIMKNLVPVLYGVPFDEEWEIKITYGFQLAMEAEIFDDPRNYGMTLRNFGLPYCLACLCGCLLPFKRIATNVRKNRNDEELVDKYGPLKSAREYLSEFRDAVGTGPFFGGSEKPGPLDVSLYGTLRMWCPGIPATTQMLLDADLDIWWNRVSEAMPLEVKQRQAVGDRPFL